MLFTSDNWAGIHPRILDAIADVNGGNVPAYGADDVTIRTRKIFGRLFGQDVTLAFVATGSAANSLALACLCPPWGAVLCHQNAHIQIDECGAPEFFTGGAKIVPIEGEQGKLTPEAVRGAMRFFTPHQAHHVKPAVLSLTQGTEAGTVYSASEVSALSVVAREFGLNVHMDGARFANALAHSGGSAAAMTSKAGVDILTLGGTKNGCMVAEAIVVFDPVHAEDLVARQKRAGQGFSKHRFLSAQWLGYFKDDLWLELAAHANGMAAQLGAGLDGLSGFDVVYPVEINEVFVAMSDEKSEALQEMGARFYDWVQPGDPYGGTLRRLVTSYETTSEEVEGFLNAARKIAD